MSKRIYAGAGGIARKVKAIYIGVGGAARKVKKGYIGVGGIARAFYASATEAQSTTYQADGLSSRPWVEEYSVALQATSAVSGAGRSGQYAYSVSLKVYHSTSNEDAYGVTVYLGASSGAKTLSFGRQNFAADGTYSASLSGQTAWLGNQSTLYLTIYFHTYRGYLTVDSHEPFYLTATDPSVEM